MFRVKEYLEVNHIIKIQLLLLSMHKYSFRFVEWKKKNYAPLSPISMEIIQAPCFLLIFHQL